MAVQNVEQRITHSSLIDFTVQGNTPNIFSVDAGIKMFAPFPGDAMFLAESGSGVTTPPVVSVGNNSPNFDNLIAATTLSSLTGAGLIHPAVVLRHLPAGASPTMRVSVAAVASGGLKGVFVIRGIER